MEPVEVVVDAEIAATSASRIEAVATGRVRVLSVRGDDPADPDVSGAEIALSGWYWRPGLFERLLVAMPRLRWIHSTGAGMDDFVTPELRERGLWITNSAGPYAPAMAEYCLWAMVTMARNMHSWLDAQRERRWADRLSFPGTILHGKRVGLVGYGAIGRHLAPACKALGMEVWALRRTPMLLSAEPVDRLLTPAELPDLLAASDFVVVVASLNSSTRGLIGAAELRALKPGAVLVNVARGDLLDQDAVTAALGTGRLAGAVLDVTTPEPLPPESPLWDAGNVLLTPHISGDTPEGWERTIDLFCANLAVYLDGSPGRMANLVDLAAHL